MSWLLFAGEESGCGARGVVASVACLLWLMKRPTTGEVAPDVASLHTLASLLDDHHTFDLLAGEQNICGRLLLYDVLLSTLA